MQIILTIASLITFGFCIYFGFSKDGKELWIMTPPFIMAILFLFFANVNRLKTFSAGFKGVTAETREIKDIVAEGKNLIKELQDLSKIMAITELGLIKRSGRLGGYSYNEKEEIKASTLNLLQQIGIPEKEIQTIVDKSKWHLYTKLDYVHLILGGNTIPQKIFQHRDRIKERKTLLNINDLPSPDKLRVFLDKCGVLTKAEEFIQDYEYYIDNHKQRRLYIWDKRDEWRKIIWE